MRFTAIIMATSALACSAAAPAPTPGPTIPEPTRTATAITPAGYYNETSIAIDPSEPQRVVAAWQVPMTIGWSADGGSTWKSEKLPGIERWQLSGDPMVTFDGDGHAYALYIAFDRPADYDTLGRSAHRNGVFVNRSDDGGRTWRPKPATVIEQPERAGVSFEDKPAIEVDRSMEKGRHGSVYVAWTEFRRRESVILFARSGDGAQNFTSPITISDRHGSPKDSVGATEGTDIAVAPDGTVYVTWSDSIGIWVDRSTDGGRTFGTDMLVARTPDIIFPVRGISRGNGYPSIAVDQRTSRVYVAWVDPRFGAPMPFVATSDNAGGTWSGPRPVARTRTDLPRFFASLAVDPSTGLVALGYYRAVSAPITEYVLAVSNDAGLTFTEWPWFRPPFHPRDEFLGDYTSIAALDGTVLGAWTEIVRADSARTRQTQPPRNARIIIGRARTR